MSDTSKLGLNNRCMRHYWITSKKFCDCGCRERVFVRDWICLNKLNEMLSDQGYKVVKK